MLMINGNNTSNYTSKLEYMDLFIIRGQYISRERLSSNAVKHNSDN